MDRPSILREPPSAPGDIVSIMTRSIALGSVLLMASSTLAPLQSAHACGGMVFPEHEQRVGGMSDQELFVMFQSGRTMLVASAGYEGIDADDFAFLLPLAEPPIFVDDADPSLFIALDEKTAPRIGIVGDYGSPGGSPGCGLRDGTAPGANGADEGEVMVQQRGQTATYEWVVVGGDTGTAIADWLSDEGYPLPADYGAALQTYSDDDWSFFAAKVRPEVTDATLNPIELWLPASTPEAFTIPLGIAAHSVPPGETLSITAYLWGEGSIVPENYATGRVDPEELVAYSETETNYIELEQALLGDPEGTWLLDYGQSTLVDDIEYAYERALIEGRAEGDHDPSYITDLFRDTSGSGHLTRIRTELGVEQLRDLRLIRSVTPVGSNEFITTYFEDEDAEESSSCTVGGSRVPLMALLWLPVLGWLRPRRRSRR